MPKPSTTKGTGKAARSSAAATTKGLIRSLNRAGVRDRKAHPSEALRGRLREPSACEHCGAVFVRRSWRPGGLVTPAVLDAAFWTICPACREAEHAEGQGRILIQGRFTVTHDDDIRARIRNVGGRAAARQPERRIVSVERQGDVLEVLTTSQKLAHRIVHELRKTFRGRAVYRWSDDGTLFATWRRER